MSDDETRELPVLLDADISPGRGGRSRVTGAGLIDVLMDIPAPHGRRRGYDDLVGRSDRRQPDGATIRVASLDDIIESQEVAARAKDDEALPELRALAERRGDGA